jgi:hypothetical protein
MSSLLPEVIVKHIFSSLIAPQKLEYNIDLPPLNTKIESAPRPFPSLNGEEFPRI